MEKWFNNLESREQMILLAGGVCVGLYLLYLLLWNPIVSKRDDLIVQNQAVAQSLASVRGLAAEYKALKKSGAAGKSPVGSNLSRIVDSSVARNQLKMNRFQPSSSGDVQVRFENAVFNNIVGWLYELETEYAIEVKELSVTPGAAAGLVNVSVRLHGNA
jgi:general secretion pathway protein M